MRGVATILGVCGELGAEPGASSCMLKELGDLGNAVSENDDDRLLGVTAWSICDSGPMVIIVMQWQWDQRLTQMC